MVKAHLVFTQRRNSYSVNIPNLENLNVEQIQELEAFVKSRNGIFDFNTYSFSIQKKIEFHEFVSLLSSLGINAKCDENSIVQHLQPRIGFGQYKGMQYNELTDSYMLWLKANYSGKDKPIIDKELKKRRL